MGPEGLNLVERNNCNTLTQLAILEQLGSNNLVIDNDLFKIRKKTYVKDCTFLVLTSIYSAHRTTM